MSSQYITLAIVLSLVLVGSAASKLTKNAKIVDSMRHLDVPEGWLPRLALLEIAGAAGLLVGIALRPLGIAAAVGVVLYFVGALVFHVRAKDYKGTPAPAALLVVALLVGLLGAASG